MKGIILDLTPGSPEWLAMRKTKIGASDAPVIMGVDAWTTPYQRWAEKVGLIEPKAQNSAMADGLRIEDDARLTFFNETGYLVTPTVIRHDSHEWMMASFDGVSLTDEVTLEIKYMDNDSHEALKEGELPEKYYPQLQHQIAVARPKKHFLMSYKSPINFCIEEVTPDDAYIELMVAKEWQFYEDIINFNPPELTDRDYIERSQDPLWQDLAYEWISLKPIVKRYDEIRDKLIELSDGHNSRGNGVRLTYGMSKGAIDYKAIPELKNVNLEAYRKPAILKKYLSEVKSS